MIEMTVAVPMFRAKYCGWIALESLVRQEGIDFEWELIVAEEIYDEPFTKETLMKYKNRLRAVGCTKILYLPFRYWDMLSNKLVLMANRSSEKSKIFATNAADLYSPPKRLKTQYDAFIEDRSIDIYSSARTIVYDILTERVYLNDGVKKLEKKRDLVISDGSCRCIRMKVMRKIPKKTNIRRSVDGWLWWTIKRYVEESGKSFVHFLDLSTDNWMYGLNVHGLNNLTSDKVRRKRFEGKRPYFIVDCPINIKETIPEEILSRLVDAKRDLKKHKKGVPKAYNRRYKRASNAIGGV